MIRYPSGRETKPGPAGIIQNYTRVGYRAHNTHVAHLSMALYQQGARHMQIFPKAVRGTDQAFACGHTTTGSHSHYETVGT